MKKPSPADRTLGLFGNPPRADDREIEVLEPEQKDGERVTIEEDADRMRDVAFKGQEWTTKYFGSPEAPGNEYRLSLRGRHYYLETLLKEPGKPTAYGYTGLMVHERDLEAMAKVLVAGYRARQAKLTEDK